MIKILIVEDEELAKDRLIRLLEEIGEGDIYTASSYEDAKNHLCKINFDAAFLDINIPTISGLELANEIVLMQPNCCIIFQTAYDEHALQAFNIGAIGYLLKPYSKEQLLTTVERALKQHRQSPTFFVKQDKKCRVVNADEIYYIQADLARTIIRVKDGFLYFGLKISDFEERLSSFGFFRAHRSFLINTNKISTIKTLEQSKLEFYFNGIKDCVESSKDGAKQFRDSYKTDIVR